MYAILILSYNQDAWKSIVNFYSKSNTEKEVILEDKVKLRRQFGTQVGKTSEEALQTWYN